MPWVVVTLLPVIGIGLLWTIGWLGEAHHFKRLAQREVATRHVVVTTLSTVPRAAEVRESILVCGAAVIAADTLKVFLFGLRTLVGGESAAAHTIVGRAHREALLRLIDEAVARGATEIHNLRFDTSNVVSRAGRQRKQMAAEVLASATAVIRRSAS